MCLWAAITIRPSPSVAQLPGLPGSMSYWLVEVGDGVGAAVALHRCQPPWKRRAMPSRLNRVWRRRGGYRWADADGAQHRPAGDCNGRPRGDAGNSGAVDRIPLTRVITAGEQKPAMAVLTMVRPGQADGPVAGSALRAWAYRCTTPAPFGVSVQRSCGQRPAGALARSGLDPYDRDRPEDRGQSLTRPRQDTRPGCGRSSPNRLDSPVPAAG
jgi:hypothetical protein